MTQKIRTMKRTILLVAMGMMAAVLMLGALDTSDAEAKKRKKRPPAVNVVVCATNPCNGTRANDYLVGTNEGSEEIYGGEGNDVYNGKGGYDRWMDQSTTSNDTYLPAKADPLNTGPVIKDDGGSSDKVDLRPYSSTDLSSGTGSYNSDLYIFIDGQSMAVIKNQESSPIEYFQFADKTLTALQIKALYG